MYCGTKDRRRSGHRCLACRQEHQKCDKSRYPQEQRHLPCSNCLKRGYRCITPAAMNEMPIIPYRQSTMKLTPTLRRQPSDSFIYTQIFFELTSNSVLPLMRAFSVESINSIGHQTPLVQRAIALVGKAYVTQSNHSLVTPQGLKSDLRGTIEELQEELMWNTSQNSSGCLATILLPACLISIVELLLCDSGAAWCSSIHKILGFVQQNPYRTRLPTQLELDLDRFLRASDVVISILFNRDVFVSSLGNFSVTDMADCDAPQTYPETEEERWDLMIQHLGAWGRLQYWSLLWMNSADNQEKRDTLNRHYPNFDRTTLGIDLVNSGAQLQRTIISHILAYSSDKSNSLSSSLLLYHYWALTGISQIFRGPQWQSLGIPLPTMNDDMAHEQAIRTFDEMERNIMSLRLDAILYIPVLTKIGLELRSTYERQRMLDVIRALRNKGIAVTGEVEKDLRSCWAILDKQRHIPSAVSLKLETSQSEILDA